MHTQHSHYTGWPHASAWGHALPAPSGHGFCRACCHPAPSCCCTRECRKESKELLVRAEPLDREALMKDERYRMASARMAFARPIVEAYQKAGDFNLGQAVGAAQVTYGIGTGFIGGGCCVHLSIEYSPSTPTAASLVGVVVDDSQSTAMAWLKLEKEHAGYQVKEGIITTKPGADVNVVVVNMTARLRWCEVFSC